MPNAVDAERACCSLIILHTASNNKNKIHKPLIKRPAQRAVFDVEDFAFVGNVASIILLISVLSYSDISKIPLTPACPCYTIQTKIGGKCDMFVTNSFRPDGHLL